MPNREIYNVYGESTRLASTRYTDWIPETSHQIATDETVPVAPGATATAADQAIDLVFTKPLLNTDGTSCVDFKEFEIFYSTSSGIDVTDPTTYSGTFTITSTKHTFPASAKHYFKVRAWDTWKNDSAASSEVNATPTVASGVPVSVDDYTNNIANVFVGKGIIGIEFQPPKTSWERWAGWKLYREDDGGSAFPSPLVWDLIYTGSGAGFLDKGTGGTLDESYHYMYKLVVLGEDGTVTSGTIKDNGANDGSGPGYQPNAADNSAVLASTIMAERIFALTELYAQDAVIGASGSLRSGQTAYNVGTGWWVGDVSGTPKLSFGNPLGKWLTLDGTDFAWDFGNCSMDASGNLTATSVDLTGTIAASLGSVGSFTIGTHLYTGSKTAYNDANAGVHLGSDGIGIGNNLFTVSAAGAVNATNLTITGGSININSGVFTVSAAGAVSCSSISCTNLSVGAGSSWGGNTLGTAYIPNLSATKITTGTLVVARTQAKCTDANADQTSTHTAANISGQGTLATLSAVGTSNCDTTIISGGKIITGLLTADNIQTGTLTGRKIQTASSGARTVMRDSTFLGGILAYNSSGNVRARFGEGEISVGNKAIKIAGTATSLKMQIDDTPLIKFFAAGTIGGSSSSNLVTLQNTIGRFTYSGATVYSGNAPTSASNLNLSSYVGARRALVLLQIENNGGSNTNYRFAIYGDVKWSGVGVDNFPNSFAARVDTTLEGGYVWCMTGTNGYITWVADIASSTVLRLIAYIS